MRGLLEEMCEILTELVYYSSRGYATGYRLAEVKAKFVDCALRTWAQALKETKE